MATSAILVNWIVVDRAASRTRTSPRAICELWSVGDDRLRFPRRLFPPDPPYEWDGWGGFWLRQQRGSDEVLELLWEVCMTQEDVGPKRTSMIRVDHHWTPGFPCPPYGSQCIGVATSRPPAQATGIASLFRGAFRLEIFPEKYIHVVSAETHWSKILFIIQYYWYFGMKTTCNNVTNSCRVEQYHIFVYSFYYWVFTTHVRRQLRAFVTDLCG